MRHPLHPMLAHFPVACWTLATLADLASLRWGQPAWHLAGTLTGIGIVLAAPTLLTGLFGLARVPDRPEPLRAAFAHMGLMLLALVLYVISLIGRLDQGHIVAPGAMARTLALAGLVAVLAGAWLGGTLVYGHGVGQTAHPNSEDENDRA